MHSILRSADQTMSTILWEPQSGKQTKQSGRWHGPCPLKSQIFGMLQTHSVFQHGSNGTTTNGGGIRLLSTASRSSGSRRGASRHHRNLRFPCDPEVSALFLDEYLKEQRTDPGIVHYNRNIASGRVINRRRLSLSSERIPPFTAGVNRVTPLCKP